MGLGIIGMGSIGTDMVQRLMKVGHECVVYDIESVTVQTIPDEETGVTNSMESFIGNLSTPRAIWMMAPPAGVDAALSTIIPFLGREDVVIDGGTAYYGGDVRRATEIKAAGVHYVHVGTNHPMPESEQQLSLVIGEPKRAANRMDSMHSALTPVVDRAANISDGTSCRSIVEHTSRHSKVSKPERLSKVLTRGAKYGMMVAYAEGMKILHHTYDGISTEGADIETTPLPGPDLYEYDLNLRDIDEVWRRGGLISSWLLDLAARAVPKSPGPNKMAVRVSDSDEGRWTVLAVIDEAMPAPVLTAALYERFNRRGEAAFADKVLSALHFRCGRS